VKSSIASSRLLRAVESSGELTPDEIASNVAVLLFGGIVTGDGANSMVIQHLLGTEDLLDEIAEDPDRVGALVDESLRLEPAAAAVDRFAARDVSLHGSAISKGDLVRVSLTAANRDPAVFSSPDVLDIHRENRARHLTFARGPHACLGAHLARAESVAVVEGILRRLDDPSLVRDETVAPEGLVFRGLERVPVEWSTPISPDAD
jgi:cytochrome P450